MSDFLPSPSSPRTFRRKLRHLGETWRPRQSKATQSEVGIWCPACNSRHGYKSKLLGLNYDKRQGVWYLLWYCVKSGNGLKEVALVANGVDGS